MKEELSLEEKFKMEEQINMNNLLERILNLNTNGLITSLQELCETASIPTESIADIRILCNNKLVELNRQFKDADLSMFAKYYKKDGVEFVGNSKLGMALYYSMMNYIMKALQNLEPIGKLKTKSMIEENNREKSLKSVGKISLFFTKIRNLFFYHKEKADYEEHYSQLKETIESKIKDYQMVCDEVYGYNLKDNMSDSILDFFKEFYDGKGNELEILEKDIIPDVEQLGFSELIPELKEKVAMNNIKDYKEESIEKHSVEHNIISESHDSRNLER